jgi:NTE family protein
MMKNTNLPTLGLALSGGGARGLAHIGVLKVFERERIPFDVLTGSSMGGIIASAYAAGVSIAELEEEAHRMSRLRQLIQLVDLSPPHRGLLTGKRLREYITRFLAPDLTFDDLNMQLGLTSVDLQSGREVPLVEGFVLDAALATSAFPGVLPPVEWNGYQLVDGGLLNNLPVDLARELGADVVIAVDVSSDPRQSRFSKELTSRFLIPDFAEYTYRAVQLLINAMTRARLEDSKPELLLRPHIASNVGTFSGFTRAVEIIAAGEEAVTKALPQLLALTSQIASLSTVEPYQDR